MKKKQKHQHQEVAQTEVEGSSCCEGQSCCDQQALETNPKRSRKANKHQPKVKVALGEQGHLSDLVVGQSCKVLALHNENRPLRRRLLDMGLTRGVNLTVKQIAPLGSPIKIGLRGYELCLCIEEARHIDIEVIEL